MICLATLAIFLAALLTPASTFIPKDTIRIIVNKVAPYSNPTESYRYYDLPFCRPAQIHEEEQTLGENLTGNRKMTSGYEAEFATNAKKKLLCKEIFSNDQLKEFRNAIDRNYIFEMFVEDFIVGNMVGHVKENKYFLATHLNFNILYNKALGKIIKATVDYDHVLNTTEITAPTGPSFPKELEFTYSIKWHETSLEHPTINNGYESFFTDEIHWFSFLNALILTTFFVLLIWRIFQRIQKTELINTAVDVEGERRDDELNWKMIRSEIFKLPPYHNLLCAALGNGTTLIIITLCICLMGAIGKFYHYKGYILTSAITLFAIMSIVGGYVSGKYHRFLGGNGWIYNIILTALLVPLPVFILIMTLNNIAWAQQATTALPFSSVVYTIIIVVIVGFPLLAVGNIFARITNEVTLNDSKELISHTSKGSKPIPSLSIYHNTFLTVFIAGLFPFSAMHVELYYLFSTMWGHKIYTMYGMVFIIFVMILNMTACVSIILTYFQLNALDHRWWWRSFFYGGSSAFYVFLYAVYFLITKTEITGFFQISYYLGYSTLLSLFIFLMMGSAGFIASSAFVRQIYERSKID